MRRMLVLLSGLAVLGVANYSITDKERTLSNGRRVFLELAPVDPRSMMQGDYMALRFQMQSAMPQASTLRDGLVIASVDSRGVATFVKLDDGGVLTPEQVRLYYRVREGRIQFGSNAFFFEEGTAARYRSAHYGEVRVAADGQMLLTGLRDVDLRELGKASQ